MIDTPHASLTGKLLARVKACAGPTGRRRQATGNRAFDEKAEKLGAINMFPAPVFS